VVEDKALERGGGGGADALREVVRGEGLEGGLDLGAVGVGGELGGGGIRV